MDTITIIKKFADDTKIGQIITRRDDSLNLQRALDNLTDWANKWKMNFNTDKCKTMHIGRQNDQSEYFMNGQKLSKTEKEKDIGVMIHRTLKPSHQCGEAARKAKAVLLQIARTFHYRDKKTFLRLYITYVRPHLEFSVSAWNPWLQKDEDILEDVQKKAIKMISGLRGQSYEEKLNELGMLSLKDRRVQFDMVQTYKIVHEVDRVKKADWFQFVEARGERATRFSEDPLNILPKRSNTEVRRKFFSNRVVNTWNKLPSEVKNANSINSFKHKYSIFIMQQSRDNQTTKSSPNMTYTDCNDDMKCLQCPYGWDA